MDLNRISSFVKVVESGSFTAAAQALGVPKSSVSRSVSQLEDSLGVRLLQRTTRQLHLTDAGRAFFERSRDALRGIDMATSEVADMGASARGTVRVTAPVDIGVSALVWIIRDFRAKYPEIQVDLSLTARVVDMVGEGFDVAIRGGSLIDSSLVAKRIWKNTEIGIFASKEYLQKHGTPKTLNDLTKHECILFRARGGSATWRFSKARSGEEAVAVKGSVMVDDMSFVSAAVEAGLGLGMLPDFLGKERPSVVRVLPEYALRDSAINVVTPSARYLPLRVSLFRDFVVDKLTHMSCGAK